MFRIILLSITLSACAPWGIEGNLWNQSNTTCPDSEYDNGGTVEPMLGYCKSGLGGFVAVNRKF